MSKGGESSRSASAQTPAQWASAQSNTSIAAWREADILGFSQAQLKALTAAQVSHITVPWAVPAAVWTADTLNAVPLQYWSKFGTRYRVTTNNGVSRITEFSQASGDSVSGQFNWFNDLGYASGGFSFSAAVIAGISNERIAQIGAGLGHNTVSAPQLTPNAGVISASDFNAALTAAAASGESVVTWTISDSETAYMFASGWANMGTQFMGALTVSQLGAIAHPETALGAAQFAYLSANQLIALSQMDWSRVSAAQLNATTISAFSGLQTNILRAISETTWGGLDKAHTMALNAAHIPLLSASAVANMQYLGYALTANVGAVLTVAQVQSIAANCWAQISDSGFLNALSTAALQAIPISAFANMADAVLASLDSVHVAALTANQAANYPLSKLSDASSAFYRDPVSLNFADFVASDNVNWRQAPASFIKRLTTEQLHLISPAQFATLSSSALAGLTRSQTQSLTLEQIQSLSASQLSTVTYISRRTDVAQQIFTASILTQMSLDFWRRVDSDFLNALSVTAFQAITSGQMTVIAANAFNRLDQVHINSLTRTQMLALTAAQVGQVNGAYLTLPFLRGVRLEAFKGLVPEQMRRLHDYLFNTVVSNAFSGGNTVELEAAEMQFATLVASIMDGDDGREAWLKQSVDLLIRLQWLDPAAAANLSASDVQNTYATLNWSWMSGSFLNNITTTVFSQLKASSIGQLNVDAVATLNDAHVQVLTATQVAAMSGEQLSAIANLGALQASAVQSLSDEQITGMTQNWGQINPTFLSHMTARQFMALTPNQFGQLKVAQLAATTINWHLIDPEQLNALPLTEFSKLCTGNNPIILTAGVAALVGLGGEQMQLLAQASRQYTRAQVQLLLSNLFGSFNTDQTQRLMNLMESNSPQQIILQLGLVNFLAKVSESNGGIDTAIQTLMALRQMQPDWLSVDNLSSVLPVLDVQYHNMLASYQSTINGQTLYYQAFATASILPLLLARQSLAFDNRALIPSLFMSGLSASISATAMGKFSSLTLPGTHIRGILGSIIDDVMQRLLRQGALADAIENGTVNRAQAESYMASLAFVAKSELSSEAAGVTNLLGKNARDARAWFAKYFFVEATKAQDTFLNQVQQSATQDMVKLAKIASATKSIQAIGNLVVMLGVATGEIGRAINAIDDEELTSTERDELLVSASLSALAFVAQGLQLPMAVVIEALVRRATGDPNYENLSKGAAIWKQFSEGYSYFYQQTLQKMVVQRNNTANLAHLFEIPVEIFSLDGANTSFVTAITQDTALVRVKSNVMVSSFEAIFDDQGRLESLSDTKGSSRTVDEVTRTVLEVMVPRLPTQHKLVIVVGNDKNQSSVVLNRELNTILSEQKSLSAIQSSLVVNNLERFIYLAVQERHLGDSVRTLASIEPAVLELLERRNVKITPYLRQQVENIVVNLHSGSQNLIFMDTVQSLLLKGEILPESTDLQIKNALTHYGLDASQVENARNIINQARDELILTHILDTITRNPVYSEANNAAEGLQGGLLRLTINELMLIYGIADGSRSQYLESKIDTFIINNITRSNALFVGAGDRKALRIYEAAMANGVASDQRIVDYINTAIADSLPFNLKTGSVTNIVESVVGNYLQMFGSRPTNLPSEANQHLGFRFTTMLFEVALETIRSAARQEVVDAAVALRMQIDPNFVENQFDIGTRARINNDADLAARARMRQLTAGELLQEYQTVVDRVLNTSSDPILLKFLRQFATTERIGIWNDGSLDATILAPSADEIFDIFARSLQDANPGVYDAKTMGEIATEVPVFDAQSTSQVERAFNSLTHIGIYKEQFQSSGQQQLWEIAPVMSADGKTVLQAGTYKASVFQSLKEVLLAVYRGRLNSTNNAVIRFDAPLEDIPRLWSEFIRGADSSGQMPEAAVRNRLPLMQLLQDEFVGFTGEYQTTHSKFLDTTTRDYLANQFQDDHQELVQKFLQSMKTRLIKTSIEASLGEVSMANRNSVSAEKQQAVIQFIRAMGEDPTSPVYSYLPVLATRPQLIAPLAAADPPSVMRAEDIPPPDLEDIPRPKPANTTMEALVGNWAPSSDFTDGGAASRGLVVGDLPVSLSDVVDPVLSKKFVVTLVDQLAIDSHSLTRHGNTTATDIFQLWISSTQQQLFSADSTVGTLRNRIQQFIIDNDLSLSDEGKPSRGIAVDPNDLMQEMVRRLGVENPFYTQIRTENAARVVLEKSRGTVAEVTQGLYQSFVDTANLPLSDQQLSYKLAHTIVKYLVTDHLVQEGNFVHIFQALNTGLYCNDADFIKRLADFSNAYGLALQGDGLSRDLAVDTRILASAIVERVNAYHTAQDPDFQPRVVEDFYQALSTTADQSQLFRDLAADIVPFVVRKQAAPSLEEIRSETAIKLARILVDFSIAGLQQTNPEGLRSPGAGLVVVNAMNDELAKPQLDTTLKSRLKRFWQSVPRDQNRAVLTVDLSPEILRDVVIERLGMVGQNTSGGANLQAIKATLQHSRGTLMDIQTTVANTTAMEAKFLYSVPISEQANSMVRYFADQVFSRRFAKLLVTVALDRVDTQTGKPEHIITNIKWVLSELKRMQNWTAQSAAVDTELARGMDEFLTKNRVDVLANGQLDRKLTVDLRVLAQALQTELSQSTKFRLTRGGDVVSAITLDNVLVGFEQAKVIVDVEVIQAAFQTYVRDIPRSRNVDAINYRAQQVDASSNFGVGMRLAESESPVLSRAATPVALNNPQDGIREQGIENARGRLSALKVAAMNFGMLGFAIFSSVVGIAAGIAGFVYAFQSTSLSWQARVLMLSMNGVRVFSSAVMLVASGAQIAANVIKGVQAASEATKIANAGFAIGNVVGITTNIAQIGLQIQATTSATDSTSRLIAGLSVLDATLQLILNVVGTIALAFGPIGVAINLLTFVIAALLPSAAAIATAVTYRESYDDLTGKGLFKEAEVMYLHWQVAAMDASPIVNWTSSIYTAEMKKAQERTMDNAWMDKSGQERLLYSLTNNTELKDNFDSLRAQMYASAAALSQPLVNLSQGLTRATMLMLSQDNLSYFEGEKLATVKLAATFNYLSNSVSRAPKLVSATVDKQLLTLTFNQNLASLNSQLPNLSAFVVKVAGVATTVSGFALLNNTITLTLASEVTAGQVVTFSNSDTTTGDDSRAVQNMLGKDAASIVEHAVVNVNNNSDTRAPLLADAVVQEQSLTLVFDEALNTKSGKIPDRRAFTVTVDGSVVDIYNMNIRDNRVLLSLERAVTSGAAVTVSYDASYGNGALQDANSNLVANLSAVSVDNTSSTATVTASRVGWLQYDNFVASTQGTGSEAASVLNGSDYTVYADEAGANAGTARLRYLSLSNAAGEFDMYSASRAVDNNDRIWLDASSAQGVSNFAINTHDMTVWGGQGKNSYSLSRQYANASYIVAANSWSGDSNLVSLSGTSGDSNQVVNLDYLLTADNISAGLLVTQTPFKVLGSADGLDEVIGSADNQTYYATSNVANVRLTGANANVAVGESAQVSVGVNGRVLVDMDMWRGLNLSQPTTTGVIKGNYGNYSLVNFAPTDTVNDSFIGKLDLRYQIGHLPTLGAFTVNAGGTNVAVTQMKISGRTVTLSLAKAVQQNQAVSVSYQDASASNDADTLQDLAGNDVGSFSGQVVSNVTADTTAPTLKVATVQGSTLIVRFSEALLQAVKPLAGDFTVKVDGTSVAVSKAVFNDSLSLRLTLASAVSAEKTVSVSYTPTSTSAVQDLAGNAAVSFSSASVVNLANVAAAPGLRSVTANGNVLTLKFDGTLRYTLNDASAFLVTVNNTPVTISSVSVVGTSVLLYLASAVTSEQSVEVSYTAPQQVSDTTTLRDWLGNGVGNLSAQLAENITGQDLTTPTLQYALVNGSSLVLTFSEALNGQAGFTPLPSAFAVGVSGSSVQVTQAVVSGSTVTLSLATAVDYGAAVSLSYTDLSASNDVAVVQDLAGNDAASFSHINVLNNTPDSAAPTLLSATVTGNQLTLLFSETLNSNSGYLPALTNMTVNAAGVAVGIVSGSLNGSTATLTLSNAVNADDYVTFNYSAPNNASNTQTFQDLSGNALLSIANFNVSNLTGVDLTPPSFVSAEVNGNTLSLTFSESLASTASFTPSLSAFSVYVDGTLSTISAVTLNGTQALLTLASAVNNTQKVTVSYSQPVNRPIQDGAGNFATSFSDKAVSNVTVDNSAPTLSSASVAGALLTLTFSENLATDSSLIPSAKQFTVNVDGAVVDVLSAVVAGKVVSVTLNKAVTATQVVSVDYTPATTDTNQLQDASGNATVHFSKTVSNWSGLASIQNATVNGTQLTLTFNQELDAMSGHLPPVSAFAVQVAGVNSTVSQLAVNGYTLTLTLDAAVNYEQEVTVNYTDPSTANDVAALQNLAGMDVQTFSTPYTAHNLTPPVADVLAPSLNSAVANASTVTLTFSEALDAGAGEWLVNYLPDGQYDAQGNPVVTSRLQASGFVNVLGSNSNDSFIIGDQSGLAVSRQLNYIQLGNGQGVQVSHYDTSGNLLLAMGSTGQADVVLESGSSLQKLLTTKLVQSDADIVKYKANRDTVTLKSLSSLTAFLAGYEVIDATESSSSLTAQIGEGDHQIKLGGQTVNLQFDKAVSTTSITTHQIPNSWLDYQYFNFNGINADGLWVGRESDGTVLFQARWTNATSGSTDNLNVSYDGTLSNVVMEVGHVLATATSSQLRLDKLIEVMSSPAFSTDPTAASKAIAVSDTGNDGAQTKLYRVTDIVAYSSQSNVISVV